ncbi:unnamed protein product [Blepharisma stoltei]|uniref:USP domain-containing protein n=1 Tax=Blepharisma stoltei TaxID=1481888 RepID=A0AAU9ICN0_9CILI|nr:unnamed protein product [Blepharisma stoltei]
MGMKSSKERGKKRKKEPELPDFSEERPITYQPLPSRNHSDIEWELKLAKNKIETLESELKDCKQKIEVLEEDKNAALEKLEKHKEYKFLSEFYIKQVEEYKNTLDKHDDMYLKLRSEYDDKIEHYKNQLQEHQGAFKFQQKYENSIKSQQIAHRLDLLDLEKRLLERKIKVLSDASYYNVNKEIEKDRNRLQEIYDEAFMSRKYIANAYYSDEESGSYTIKEKEGIRMIKPRDYDPAKCLDYFRRKSSETARTFSYSNTDSIKSIPRSGKYSSYSNTDSHHTKARSVANTTETWDTQYEPEQWNLYISSFKSLSQVLEHFIDLSKEIKSRVNDVRNKLLYLLKPYKNHNQEYMKNVLFEFFKGFSRRIDIPQLYKSPADLFNHFLNEFGFEKSPPNLFDFQLSKITCCEFCNSSLRDTNEFYLWFQLKDLPFTSIQSFIKSSLESYKSEKAEHCASCMEIQRMNCSTVFLTLPKYLVFEDDPNNLNSKIKNRQCILERRIFVNEDEYNLFAFIFKNKENLYMAKIFDKEASDESLSLKRGSRYSSALMIFYIKKYITYYYLLNIIQKFTVRYHRGLIPDHST